jgi:hypothetical protein
VGRLTSADTVRPNAPGTQGYNPYAYVANNPTTWVDPTGHFANAGAGTRPAFPKVKLGATEYALLIATAAVAAVGLTPLGIAIRDSLLTLAWVLVDAKVGTLTIKVKDKPKGKWYCSASCNVEGRYPDCNGHVTGSGGGNSEGAACRNAKRDAVHQPRPAGCVVRHCQCTCVKQ